MAGNPLENINVPEANAPQRPDLNKGGGLFSHFKSVFQSPDMNFGQKLEFLFDMMIPSLRWHRIPGLDPVLPFGENSFRWKFPMPYFDMDHRILKAGVMTTEGFEALRNNKLQPTEAFNRAAQQYAAKLENEAAIDGQLVRAEVAADELTEEEIKHGGKLELASTKLNEQVSATFGQRPPETVSEPRPSTAPEAATNTIG